MRELLGTEEVWELTGDHHNTTARATGTRIAWREEGRIYVLDYPSLEFNLDELDAPPPIPFDHLVTLWQNTYLQAADPLPPDAYIKSLSPITYRFDHPAAIGEELRHEIEAYTLLSTHPHPNICRFYGCIRDGKYATGLALRRFPATLQSLRDAESSLALTRLRVLRGIKRGLDHLHSLGLVHNDLNPNNIMIDDDSNPVIVDFGSCRREGAPKDRTAGTPGWYRESDRSVKENDYFALGLIARWLDGWEHDPMVDYKVAYLRRICVHTQAHRIL